MRLDYGPPKPLVAEYTTSCGFRVVERSYPLLQRVPQGRAGGGPPALCDSSAARRHHGATARSADRHGISGGAGRRGAAMNLSTEYLGIVLPHPLWRARYRWPTISTASDDSKTPAPRPSSCDRSLKSRSHGSRCRSTTISSATRNRSPRPPPTFPPRTPSRWARSIPQSLATGEGSGPHSRHGVAERRHARRLDRLRPADAGGRRRRAGAEPLSASRPTRRRPARRSSARPSRRYRR